MSQAAICALALTFSVVTGLVLLYGHPDDVATTTDVAAQPTARPAATKPSTHRIALLDPIFASGYKAATFALSVPLAARFEASSGDASHLGALPPLAAGPSIPPLRRAIAAPTQDIPLPAPRPSALMPARIASAPASNGRRLALLSARPVSPVLPSDPRKFFEKLFGASRAPGQTLAYAAPEDSGLGLLRPGSVARPLPYDRWTAVYDIAAHTVTLPDGTRLEAHSGLGNRLDDPRGVAERMRGATPPNLYELQQREQLFHGVRALRLNPVGDGTTYGRGGLLAHTYMLGPRGDSNGCVVFKNYGAFLQAYDAGTIKHLAVVARMN